MCAYKLNETLRTLVALVVLSVFMENSGMLKAGPKQVEYEAQNGKTYLFSDVHGVDEVKNASSFLSISIPV
jgi:ATP-dependent metalloprotease